MVIARVDVFAKQRAQRRRAIEIGKALRQINGVVIGGELRHDGEDRSADVGEFGSDGVRIVLHGCLKKLKTVKRGEFILGESFLSICF